MFERSEVVFKILCAGVGALVLWQVVRAIQRSDPLAGASIPALPSLPASTNIQAGAKGTNAPQEKPSARGTNAVARGTNAVARGTNAVARGTNTVAQGTNTVAQGTNTVAQGTNTVAQGTNTVAQGTNTVPPSSPLAARPSTALPAVRRQGQD